MDISGTRWPREVIILISESSELVEDNAAGEQVNELRRVMRASESAHCIQVLGWEYQDTIISMLFQVESMKCFGILY